MFKLFWRAIRKSWAQLVCVSIWNEHRESRASDTVGLDKTDDKAEGIDDKLLTVLAHVSNPNPPADI